MALIPRWRFMSEEAKALAKRTAVSGALLLLVALLFRGLLPWLALVLLLWWGWRWLNR